MKQRLRAAPICDILQTGKIMSKIGIIGYGIVGKAVGDGFASKNKNQVYWYSRGKGPWFPEEVVAKSEFLFICVPTPMFSDGSGIDLSIINNVVKFVAPKIRGTKKILTIKSTVVPGTTTGLAKKYPGVNFAMNPEFLTEKNAPKDFLHPDRTVIGAMTPSIGKRLAKLYQDLYGKKTKIFVTDTMTAEMVKYMSNSYLATKVIFANEIWEMCQKIKVNYDKVLEMVAADPRIGDAHLKVTKERGFGGKCFPKDIVAFLGLARKLKVDLSVIKTVWAKNLKIRKVKDWETIEGAVNHKKK